MKKVNAQIIVTGSISYDEIMNFPDKFINFLDPLKLHQINVSFVVDKLEKQLGGTGLNIAYNITRVSSSKPVLIGAMGIDSQTIYDFCLKNNIETSGIYVDKKLYTATGKVITDINDNQIWGFYYGASKMGSRVNIDTYISNDSIMILSATHTDSFLYAQKVAIESNIHYMYDPGMTLTWIKNEDLRKGIENCYWLIGNDYELSQIQKRLHTNIESLLKKKITIITTLGDKGVEYRSTDERIKVDAYKVKKLIDPTGAGDAWRAGFIGGIVENKSVKESLAMGNALASFAVESYGTVNHRPTRTQVMNRAKSLL